jgi:hypothetical protein
VVEGSLEMGQEGPDPLEHETTIKMPRTGQCAGFWWVDVCDPSRQRCEAATKEWSQERAFDTLQECESYRERQADEFIKRMETVPEGSSDYKMYDAAAMRFLLGRCTLAEFLETQ